MTNNELIEMKELCEFIYRKIRKSHVGIRNIQRLAVSKCTDFITNEEVLKDLKSKINKNDKDDNEKYYWKIADSRMPVTDLTANAFTGFLYTPANNDVNKANGIYKEELYGIEVHSFYRKDLLDVVMEVHPEVKNMDKYNPQRREIVTKMNKEIIKLPPKINIIYKAIYKNKGTQLQVNFNLPSSISKDFNYDDKLNGTFPINPETANDFQNFQIDGVEMILLKGFTTIQSVNAFFNTQSSIINI